MVNFPADKDLAKVDWTHPVIKTLGADPRPGDLKAYIADVVKKHVLQHKNILNASVPFPDNAQTFDIIAVYKGDDLEQAKNDIWDQIDLAVIAINREFGRNFMYGDVWQFLKL